MDTVKGYFCVFRNKIISLKMLIFSMQNQSHTHKKEVIKADLFVLFERVSKYPMNNNYSKDSLTKSNKIYKKIKHFSLISALF